MTVSAPHPLLHGPAIIENVFSHGEPQTDHSGIDDSIDDAVKLILLPKKQDQKNQALALSSTIGAEYGAKVAPNLRAVGGGGDDLAVYRIQNYGDEDRDQRTPEEGW